MNAVTTHGTMSATIFARKEFTVRIGCTILRVGVTKLLAREGGQAFLSLPVECFFSRGEW